MRTVREILLVLALFTAPAWAHRDLILTVKADGSIPQIPASLGQASLIVEGLGSEKPLIQLRIGPYQTTLPFCVARMIRTEDPVRIQVTGSWHHDQTRLPYYINIEFFDPGYNPGLTYNSSQRFLFNLHNAQLIQAKTVKAIRSGGGAQSSALELPAGCKLN